MNTSFASGHSDGANHPSIHAAPQQTQPCVSDGKRLSSEFYDKALSPEELEQHIRDCGWQAQLAMCRWEAHGCFSDRGDADYWALKMKKAIALRSPETVARMERERGLA